MVAATHRDLKAMVAAGSFRQDLYYRLAGYEISIPPLRERISDLPDLVEHFQKRFLHELGLTEAGQPSQQVLAVLSAHAWPGNVRELGHVIRRVLIETGSLDNVTAVQRILGAVAQQEGKEPTTTLVPAPFNAPFVPLDEMERMYVLSVLSHTKGNKTEAAKILGIERKTLARRLRPTEGGDAEDPDGGAS